MADGYAAGLDLKLYGEFVPGTDSWISLGLMKTEEKIDGVKVPRPTDQRLNCSLFFSDFFPGTDRWKMTLRGHYAGGLPFGPPHTGRENQFFRMKSYRRVDIGMSYRLFNNENRRVNYGIGGVGSTGNAMGASMPVKSFPWGVSSPFGYRGTINTPAGPTNPFHDGIDLTNGEGTPIGANNSGIVVASTTASDGANYVIINSGDGYEQLYWHLMKPSHLIKGQHVNAGQLIGYMGQTGMATGPHLHFGLRHAGTKNYLDPAGYINATLFSPTDAGIPGLGVLEEEETPSTQILRKMIDADTTSNAANSMANYGVGSDQVVDSVNNGFTNLIDKLEELSKRQDRQEDVLKMLAQSKGTNVYRY